MQVARAADFGMNDNRLTVYTHLGHVLKAGDTVLGYDLLNSTNDNDLEEYVHAGMHLPEVVLVRKSYRDKRRKRREAGIRRHWKVKTMQTEDDQEGLSTRQVPITLIHHPSLPHPPLPALRAVRAHLGSFG